MNRSNKESILMFKFAVICGALVLSSASLFAQSKDKSSHGSNDGTQKTSSSAPSRPSDTGRGRTTNVRPPETIRKDPPRQTGSERNNDRNRDRGYWGGVIVSHPIERGRPTEQGNDRRKSDRGGTGSRRDAGPIGGSPIDTGSSGGRHRDPIWSPPVGGSRDESGRKVNDKPILRNPSSWGGQRERSKDAPPIGGDRGRDRGDGSIHIGQTPQRDQSNEKHQREKPPFNGGLIQKDPPHLQGWDTRKGHDHPEPIHHPPRRIVDIPDDWHDRDRDRDWNRIYISYGDDWYRRGYVYCNDWYRTPRWHYGNYCYEPSSLVVISPFYYYPELPPYLNVNCVTYGGYYSESSVWTPYYYSYPGSNGFRRDWDDDPFGRSGFNRSYSYDDSRYGERTKFDRALDNIVDAFAQGDSRFIEGLIPSSGSVAISQDNFTRYSLGANDFANLYRDLIETTRSRGYEVLSARVYDDDSARVVARHTRLDAYGNVSTVYHVYNLAYEGRRFVIRRFGVNYSNFE